MTTTPVDDRPAEEVPPARPLPKLQPLEALHHLGRGYKRNALDVIEGGFPGILNARPTSLADLWAYHKAAEYMPLESGLLRGIARVFGVYAVAWVVVWRLVGWSGEKVGRHILGLLFLYFVLVAPAAGWFPY